MFDHKVGVSQRQAAKKFNCSKQHVNKTFKKWQKLIQEKKWQFQNVLTSKQQFLELSVVDCVRNSKIVNQSLMMSLISR